ncbi:hypothetical protein DKX38_021179 [Salix brachista]|uniref:Uncharacterized protein n=1 Tax=Salix brachista TaxID=2182728 RepID=A0A5N5K7T4_9ROSI|nr:hypothetical protein DKX38_021179 [Salix brachista]
MPTLNHQPVTTNSAPQVSSCAGPNTSSAGRPLVSAGRPLVPAGRPLSSAGRPYQPIVNPIADDAVSAEAPPPAQPAAASTGNQEIIQGQHTTHPMTTRSRNNIFKTKAPSDDFVSSATHANQESEQDNSAIKPRDISNKIMLYPAITGDKSGRRSDHMQLSQEKNQDQESY